MINTHYDDRGVKARAESSLMIREHAYQWVNMIEDEDKREKSVKGSFSAVILLGDFSMNLLSLYQFG